LITSQIKQGANCWYWWYENKEKINIKMISHFNKQGKNGGMLQFCNFHWRSEEEDHSARLTDNNKVRLYLKKHI
jgi:hypothetical protein